MLRANIVTRFGASVRRLRYRLGISQEELAGRADLHRTYIAGIERGGRNITLKSIDKLAGALQVPAAELLSPADESPREMVNRKVLDILMVEDDPGDAALTLAAFHEAGMANRIQVIANGAVALDYFFCTGAYTERKGKKLPSVILLDLHLPKVSGLEVLRRIKDDARTRSVPVIILTASRQHHDLAECWRLGAATYIVKPVDFQNFSRVTAQLHLRWALLERQLRIDPPPSKALRRTGEE